jgi:hypothetical protein
MNLDDERGESPSATPMADDYPEGAVAPSKPGPAAPRQYRTRFTPACGACAGLTAACLISRTSRGSMMPSPVLWNQRSGAGDNPENRGAHRHERLGK